jgi:hypothetical protein
VKWLPHRVRSASYDGTVYRRRNDGATFPKSSIIPIGDVALLFGGSENESFEIRTGEYNKKLDAQIAEIQKQCDLK